MDVHPDSKIIDALGGPTAVAGIFGIKPQAVSQWRTDGIPKARRMYLQLAYPAHFSQPADDGGQQAAA